jgi:hypothetical protein
MSDIDTTLVNVLETITGVKVYVLEKPVEATLPAVVYMRVSRKNFMTHTGATDIKRDWMQITHIATTYSGLKSLVTAVESKLIGNHTDFEISIPTDSLKEFKEDGLYVAVRDFFIYNK